MEELPAYDRWKTTEPFRRPSARCAYCEKELFSKDYAANICGEILCTDHALQHLEHLGLLRIDEVDELLRRWS